ncbi:hypothetical protein NP493_2068g00002 [Ridgeia piscesae]|uniref:Myosin motor domain-containing protein n=1 Tax=Ridgeia piscesae TaxID=27915 RepID=A0AAD9N586_RIDPI|nr:hypothetical protein NP493_2068g00002 [Ridgeia piscesae]
MAARYAKLDSSKHDADSDAISLTQIATTAKNVRFRNEPAADYDDPEPDYDSDGAGNHRYNGARPKHGVAVLPALPGSAAGNLRQTARSADTEHDLSAMENLNEVSILHVLKERFKHDVIQTYIGDVLIVVNPYKKLDFYGDRYHEMYKFVNKRTDLEPHIYWTVDHAYRQMTDTTKNQVILISGESGAGKTESTKLVVKHLTHICQSTMSNLHDRIVKVNPLLEAFGNAQTVMNQNSSRFGKFVELNFNASGHMKGACIHDYLLEKSRVVHIGPHERNFHVFYYMFAGMPAETLRYYYLEDPMAHRILKSDHNQKRMFYDESDRKLCKQKFEEMEEIMGKVAFTKDDISTIYMCLAAVLYITNVEFQPEDDNDGVTIVDDFPVNYVSDLLTIDVDKLKTSLMCRTSVINEEDVIALKTMEQANDERDAVAKALYSRLFGWIVRQVNSKLVDSSSASATTSNSIGILDLSGFENFVDNSFEQLCINVANEKLQYFFNTFIFATEQAIYAEEGIDWSHIEFQNNEDILRLFLGDDDTAPSGSKRSFRRLPNMFTILDDESKSPQTTDSSLVRNWSNNLSDAQNFKSVSGDELAFVITHFADEVTYSANNFLEKNRDRLGANLVSLLQKSENDFIKDLFSAELADTGVLSRTKSKIRKSTGCGLGMKSRKSGRGSVTGETVRKLKTRGKHQMPGTSLHKVQTTASQYFKKSLEELMRKMRTADPLFVRCIKPNLDQERDMWSDKLVQRQLQYSGVLQIAKIARLGYPVRMSFCVFYKRFAMIFQERVPMPSGDACRKALKAAGISDEKFAIGKTKVFMKEDLADHLRLATLGRASVCLQRAIRGHVARRVYQAKKEEEARKRREVEERKRQELKARQQRELEQSQRALEREKARKDAELAASGSEETKPRGQDETPPTEHSVSLARQTS